MRVADEADRAPGRGFTIETTPGVAAECGAPAAGEADAVDCLEEALEADLRPFMVGRCRKTKGSPAAHERRSQARFPS